MITYQQIEAVPAAFAAAQVSDWNACSAAMTAKTIEVRDPSPATYAKLTAAFGDEARMLVAGTIRAAIAKGGPEAGELADAHSVLLIESGGLRIDSDSRQAILDALAQAGKWPDQLRDGIKSMGKRYESPAQQAGLNDEDCSAEACEQAQLDAIAVGSARQTRARIAAQRAAIRSLDADSIVSDAPLTLDAAVGAIRAALTAFGGFA